VRPEGLGKLRKKTNDLIWSLTREEIFLFSIGLGLAVGPAQSPVQ
jgi:hypothetical protein